MTTSAPAAPVTGSDGHPAPQGPEPILQLAAGFMAAKHLFAASELGLFEALAGSPATIDALAARTGLTRRAARISADAMVALGLLERDGGTYRNSDTAATFLAGATPADLRPLLRFWDKISYPSWAGFAGALATGPSQEITKLDDALQQVASRGIEAMLTGPAAALAATVDFPARQRLLDVGGGTGSWSIAIARAHPHMKATVFELPAVAAVAMSGSLRPGLARVSTWLTATRWAGRFPAGTTPACWQTSSTTTHQQKTRRCCGTRVPRQHRAAVSCWWTSGPTPHIPSRSWPRSWPVSSPPTSATATSTASAKPASGWSQRAGGSPGTNPWPGRSASLRLKPSNPSRHPPVRPGLSAGMEEQPRSRGGHQPRMPAGALGPVRPR